MMGRSVAGSAGHVVQLARALAGSRAVQMAIVLVTSPACGCSGTVDTVPDEDGGPGPSAGCGERPDGPESCDHGDCGPHACWTGSLCVARRTCIRPGYWIDSTEVTRDQYGAWLDTNPALAPQPPTCAFNDDYTPNSWCMSIPPTCKGSACGGQPETCVDWCDANAYCAAIGKRLCGRVGGGALAHDEFANAVRSEWFNACSSGGVNLYPYGNVFLSDACNGGGHGAVPVATMTECQSSIPGYEGVYDLGGNTREWVNDCEGQEGIGDPCRVAGGTDFNGPLWLRCDTDERDQRGSPIPTGFRCCGP